MTERRTNVMELYHDLDILVTLQRCTDGIVVCNPERQGFYRVKDKDTLSLPCPRTVNTMLRNCSGESKELFVVVGEGRDGRSYSVQHFYLLRSPSTEFLAEEIGEYVCDREELVGNFHPNFRYYIYN